MAPQWQRVAFWAMRPIALGHRVRYWMWEHLNPDVPWLCPGTVRFCASHFSGAARGLEFGSGRSTAWFARFAGRLTSVEHSREWYDVVQERLRAGGVTNIDYRLVPLDTPESEPEREAYAPMPAYVRVADEFPDRSLDFVVVDGHYRTHCVRRSLTKIARGGHLLVDDVNMWRSIDELEIPAAWSVVDDSSNGLKRCVIWRAP